LQAFNGYLNNEVSIMNTILASTALPATSAPSTKPLWAAVGVLGVCVLAMGATLVQVNQRPEPLAQASIPLASARATPLAALAPSNTAMITEKSDEKPPLAGIKSAQSAPKSVVNRADPVAAATRSSPAANSDAAPVAVQQTPAKPVCASCGTVEAVTPITRNGQGSGVGAVAGGVLGGVVGNQVGNGSGRAVATVIGAIGGGVAGNAIEKNMKKTTVYNVRIRMNDGTSRSIEQSSAPLVGSKITLDGNTMRPA
jgi:outer membrane lipoprotein SlyB